MKRYVILISIILHSLTSLHAQQPVVLDSDTLLELTHQQADSLSFRFMHHYTINFNFLIVVDSMALVPHETDIIDTCYVYKDDVVVVADIRYSNQGDVWIKLFCDQMTMGWVKETELLKCAIPNDRISEALFWLSGSRGVWMSLLLLLGIFGFFFMMKRKRKIHVFQKQTPRIVTLYSVMLVMLVIVLATLYAGIQTFAPEYWQEYYFHPTLNPLMLPNIMALLVLSVWLVVIVFIALIFVIYDYFFFAEGVYYLLETTGICMLAYLMISWMILFIF